MDDLANRKRYENLDWDVHEAILESIETGFCIIDLIFDECGRPTDYRFIECNPAFERHSGLTAAVGRRIREFAPDIEEHWLERYGAVALTGEPLRIEGEVAALGRWFDINAFRVGAHTQSLVAVLFTDISVRCLAERDLRESEERQRLLLAELQHRVRNILAMIQSIIRQSLHPDQSAEDYVAHLSSRVAAMARTQVILTRNVNLRVSLQEVVRDELLSSAGSHRRFQCGGVEVLLDPKAAEVLTLAIHELATNSLKYGAFAGTSGDVEIHWTVETRSDEQWLCFTWKETGCPHSGFGTSGFGTQLITQRVPYELRGTGSLIPTDEGMVARIEFPLRYSGSVLETGMGKGDG